MTEEKLITLDLLQRYHDKDVDETHQMIDDAEEVVISSEKPTKESIKLWINTDGDDSAIALPEINDAAISSTDTWSSAKISSQIQENVITTIEDLAVTYEDVDRLFE